MRRTARENHRPAHVDDPLGRRPISVSRVAHASHQQSGETDAVQHMHPCYQSILAPISPLRGPARSLACTARIVPTAFGAEMLTAGTSKLAWLNRFVKLICTRKKTRSRIGNDLNMARLAICRPGPMRMPRPELPNRPALAGGATKAEASNQRSIVR